MKGEVLLFFYFISYLTLMIFSFLEIFQSKVKNIYLSKSLFAIVIVILAIFSGIRYQIGVDYNSYLSIFSNVTSTLKPPFINLETGFKAMVIFFKSLSFPAISLFFFFSLILLLFIQRGIERSSKYRFYSLFIFFLIFLITYVFNALRQGIAMSIFIYLIPDIKNKKFIKVAIFSVIAFMIHNSGVFILVSYFLYFFSFDRKTYVILTLASIFYYFYNEKFINLIIIILPDFFSSKLTNFLEKFSGEVDFTSFILRLVLLGILLLYYQKLKELNGYQGLFNIYFFGFLFYVIFSFQSQFATRINMFFRILEIILLPALLVVEKDKLRKFLLYLFISAIATAIFLMTLQNPLNFPFNYYWNFNF